MLSLLIAFFASLISNFIIIRTQEFHGSFSGDSELNGPQKFHSNVVPRIGGLGIGIAVFTSIVFHQSNQGQMQELLFLVCALPVFGAGIAEDITKRVTIRTRLLFTTFGALLFVHFTNTPIQSLGIPLVDHLLSVPLIAASFAIFAITGMTNSYNIIDGFNGLASMVGMIALVALAYMGFIFDDKSVIFLCLVMTSAILGFFILNYPNGLIFLGDGGAYLIGYWVACISILIYSRHPQISPWFAIMVNGYPILETLFTIYRRKFHQNKNPGHPDGMHFHSLIFRRVLNRRQSIFHLTTLSANAKTSPYLWIFSSISVIPAVLFWHSTPILLGFAGLFVTIYLWLYKKIASFNTPDWLHF